MAIALGCATSPAPESGADEGLLPSLTVTTASGAVTFNLQVTNVSDAPIELVFPDGQSAEFVVRRNGEEIWRWSDGQMFTQAVRQITLAPGESRSYSGEWRPGGGTTGQFVAVGTLTASGRRVEQAVQFGLP